MEKVGLNIKKIAHKYRQIYKKKKKNHNCFRAKRDNIVLHLTKIDKHECEKMALSLKI